MAGNERWSFSKNPWKYDFFCIFDIDGIAFSFKLLTYPSVKKPKIIFSQKIHLQMTFPASLKKMILILENMILAF